MQAQPQTLVTIPPGIAPGMAFAYTDASGNQAAAICPEGAAEGMQIMMPAQQAQAPTPVVMAEPVVVSATAVTVAPGNPPGPVADAPVRGPPGQRVFTLGLEQLGENSYRKWYDKPPPELKSIQGPDWTFAVRKCQEYDEANGFYKCPCLETCCFFTCCWGGVCCPCFCVLGKYDSRKRDLENSAVPAINERLAQYGLKTEFEETSLTIVLHFSYI